eukprot:TRINITY_DN9853_c2_g1_i1.p1 TRINITY_DN9853_c2_g1~~TRINITY_DN9853_c2_g1_i1.p1  ORF type:complete len:226 (-),score=-9.94 TRINITY_DN9853_c2_g1_i1:114-791(-)
MIQSELYGDIKPFLKEFFMNKNIKITPIQKEILFGTLLGDAWLESSTKGQTYRYGFKQKLDQKPYVLHIWTMLQTLCGSAPIENNGCLQFKTLTLGSLRFYAHQFYENKNKKVPQLIHRWLTPRALAYWYMDDGYKDKKNACLLCTDGFEKKDVLKLCYVLNQNFGLNCHLRKRKLKTQTIVWRIYISSSSGPLFRSLIQPYVVDSMVYKLPSKQQANRVICLKF